MRILRTTRHSPIGIDVGRYAVKAVQLRIDRGGGDNRPCVEAVASLLRDVSGGGEAGPLSPAEVHRLAAVLDRRGFHGNVVVLAAPQADVVRGPLELPPRAPGISLAPIARNEFCRAHKLDPAAVEVAHWEVPAPARAPRATYAMAAACPHAASVSLVETFALGGLDVAAVDLDACATARSVAALAGEGDALTPVVDVGWGAATLIVLRRGAPVFERTLGEAGVRALRNAIVQQTKLAPDAVTDLLAHASAWAGPKRAAAAAEIELPPDLGGQVNEVTRSHFEALADEVHASMSYVTQRYADAPQPERALMIGGGAELPGATEALGAALGFECRAVTPAASVSCPAELTNECGAAMAMAVGLAMYEVS